MLVIKARKNLIASSFVWVLLLLAGPESAVAQEKLGLNEIIRQIEQNNPELKAFENQAKSQEARVEGAGAWMAPMVGAGTFMSPYPGQEVMSDGDRGAFMISAEQDIPNPAKVKARREYLATLAETYTLGRTERLNQLRTRARQLYFDLLIANRKLNYQRDNQKIMQTMQKLAEIRYPYNQSGLNQIYAAKGRAAESENMILMTEGQIRSNKIALNALMNRPASSALQIDTSYVVSFKPVADLDTTYLAEIRSDIRHMQHNIHSMEANINQMRQEAKPDFRIRFDHMSSYSAMMPKQFTVMGMLSIPIAPWSSKMYKSEIKSMNFEIAAMQQQKEAMLVEMLAMARSMETELASMQQQLNNYEKGILPALKKALDVSMLSYQENKLELNSVIDNWEALNMAQMNYLDQLQRYYKMITEYEQTIER